MLILGLKGLTKPAGSGPGHARSRKVRSAYPKEYLESNFFQALSCYKRNYLQL